MASSATSASRTLETSGSFQPNRPATTTHQGGRAEGVGGDTQRIEPAPRRRHAANAIRAHGDTDQPQHRQRRPVKQNALHGPFSLPATGPGRPRGRRAGAPQTGYAIIVSGPRGAAIYHLVETAVYFMAQGRLRPAGSTRGSTVR